MDCPAVASCSTIRRLVALPADGSESAADAIPPPSTQIIATAGTTSALPPLGWLNDTATWNPRRYLRRQPVIYPPVDGWMAYAALQSAQPVIPKAKDSTFCVRRNQETARAVEYSSGPVAAAKTSVIMPLPCFFLASSTRI